MVEDMKELSQSDGHLDDRRGFALGGLEHRGRIRPWVSGVGVEGGSVAQEHGQ